MFDKIGLLLNWNLSMKKKMPLIASLIVSMASFAKQWKSLSANNTNFLARAVATGAFDTILVPLATATVAACLYRLNRLRTGCGCRFLGSLLYFLTGVRNGFNHFCCIFCCLSISTHGCAYECKSHDKHQYLFHSSTF